MISANVEKDIADIGKSVNEKTVVNPRYGSPFDSLPLAIQKVMEAGGFQPFLTETALLASVPTVSPKAAKALDTGKVWYWDGSWHNTGLSELDQAKTYTKEKVAKVEQKIPEYPFNDEVLFQFADADGKVVLQINKDGSVNFVGLEQSIQKEVQNIVSKVFERTSENVFEILDKDGNYVLKINQNSEVFIPGLVSDITTSINNKPDAGLSIEDTSNLSSYSYRDTFIPKAQTLLSFFRTNQNVGLIAPVPLHSFEQNFSITETWLDQAKFNDWGNYIPVGTPYGQDRGVVHPHILEFPNKFMGFRYIVSITGYTNGATAEENPFLLGSNDLQSFELLTPLLDEPDSYIWQHGTCYNSDVFTYYDVKTSELCLAFRTYWADTDGIAPNETFEKLFVRRSKDGLV